MRAAACTLFCLGELLLTSTHAMSSEPKPAVISHHVADSCRFVASLSGSGRGSAYESENVVAAELEAANEARKQGANLFVPMAATYGTDRATSNGFAFSCDPNDLERIESLGALSSTKLDLTCSPAGRRIVEVVWSDDARHLALVYRSPVEGDWHKMDYLEASIVKTREGTATNLVPCGKVTEYDQIVATFDRASRHLWVQGHKFDVEKGLRLLTPPPRDPREPDYVSVAENQSRTTKASVSRSHPDVPVLDTGRVSGRLLAVHPQSWEYVSFHAAFEPNRGTGTNVRSRPAMLQVLDAIQHTVLAREQTGRRSFVTGAYSREGSHVLILAKRGGAALWRYREGALLWIGNDVVGFAFIDDRRFLLQRRAEVQEWDAHSGEVIKAYPVPGPVQWRAVEDSPEAIGMTAKGEFLRWSSGQGVERVGASEGRPVMPKFGLDSEAKRAGVFTAQGLEWISFAASKGGAQ